MRLSITHTPKMILMRFSNLSFVSHELYTLSPLFTALAAIGALLANRTNLRNSPSSIAQVAGIVRKLFLIVVVLSLRCLKEFVLIGEDFVNQGHLSLQRKLESVSQLVTSVVTVRTPTSLDPLVIDVVDDLRESEVLIISTATSLQTVDTPLKVDRVHRDFPCGGCGACVALHEPIIPISIRESRKKKRGAS